MPVISASKYMVRAGWDDVPHLSQQVKDELWESTPPYLRDARSRGLPVLGAGAIYPIDHEAIKCDPFPIPKHFPKAYGLDVGWNRTAALWGALDREADILYCYNEYYRGEAEPPSHAAAIKARGAWIKGAIDPAARGRTILDGRKAMREYQLAGLNVVEADNAREAGLLAVLTRMAEGRLKIFSTLTHTFSEMSIYRRDTKGRVVKEYDHLMDCLRYLVMTGVNIAMVEPQARLIEQQTGVMA